MAKKRILFIMRRRMLSDAITIHARSHANFEISSEQNYAMAVLTAEAYLPNITVVEVPESGEWKDAVKCLSICGAVRNSVPECRQVLLCSENDGVSCNAAIQAKRDGRIDDFLYYEASVNYLFSKLEALL